VASSGCGTGFGGSGGDRVEILQRFIELMKARPHDRAQLMIGG
jgi:hypothetical protein